MKRRFFLMLASTVVLTAVSGCRTTRESVRASCGRPPYVGPIPGIAPCDRCRQSAYPPGRIAPIAVPGRLAAGDFRLPAAPVGECLCRSERGPTRFLLVVGLARPSGRSLLDPGVHLAAPEPIGSDSVSDSTDLYERQKSRPPLRLPSVPRRQGYGAAARGGHSPIRPGQRGRRLRLTTLSGRHRLAPNAPLSNGVASSHARRGRLRRSPSV